MFFASKRNAQAVTTLMGDTKVELGDDVAVSHGSELVVRSEDLEGANEFDEAARSDMEWGQG